MIISSLLVFTKYTNRLQLHCLLQCQNRKPQLPTGPPAENTMYGPRPGDVLEPSDNFFLPAAKGPLDPSPPPRIVESAGAVVMPLNLL